MTIPKWVDDFLKRRAYRGNSSSSHTVITVDDELMVREVDNAVRTVVKALKKRPDLMKMVVGTFPGLVISRALVDL